MEAPPSGEVGRTPPQAEPYDISFYSQALANLPRALRRQIKDPQGGDPYVSACAEAMESLLDDPEFKEFELEGLAYRQKANKKPLNGEGLFDVNFRVINKQLLRLDPNYPNETYLKAKTYRSAIRDFLHDSSEEGRPEAIVDMTRDIMSNIPQRYSVDKVIMVSEQERLGPEIAVLDIGSAFLRGLNQLASNQAFEPISWGSIDQATKKRRHPKLLPREDAAALFDAALDEPLNLRAVGVDQAEIKDLGNRKWAQACTYRPLELMRLGRSVLEEFEDTPHPDVRFYLASLATEGIVPHSPNLPPQDPLTRNGYNLITLHTIEYQLPPELQDISIEVLRRDYLAEDGLIVIQDYAVRKGARLHYRQGGVKRKDFTNRTFVVGLKGEDEVSELFRARDGRYREIALGRDITHLTMARDLKAA